MDPSIINTIPCVQPLQRLISEILGSWGTPVSRKSRRVPSPPTSKPKVCQSTYLQGLALSAGGHFASHTPAGGFAATTEHSSGGKMSPQTGSDRMKVSR